MSNRSVISEHDWRTMMGIVRAVADDGPDPMPEATIAGLHDLVPCANVSFLRYDSATRVFDFEQSYGVVTDGVDFEALDVAFWTHYWDSPCSYPDRTEDLDSVTTGADFLSDRQLRSSGMYCEYFRPLGIRRDMMLCLPSRPGRVLRLLFFRDQGTYFSDRDRDVLALLRPHIFEAVKTQAERRRPRAELTPRQRQTLRLVAEGYTNRQIARRLSVTEATVRKHLENAFIRLGAGSRTEAVLRAFGDEPV